MRILDVLWLANGPTARPPFLPYVVGATSLLVFGGMFVLFFGGGFYGGSALPRFGPIFDAELWSVWCLAAVAWWTAHVLGAARAGTGAGLVLSLFGLVCRLRGTMSALWIAGANSADDAVRSALTLASFHRNAGHVAFGLGLGLVATSCVLDAVRRRRDPRWTRPEG